jgi:fluoride ion exporter CrcB/FEX
LFYHLSCARDDPLLAGFCGSLTTWASWNQAMVERLVAGDWARALIGYLLGAELAAASLVMGQHAAAALWHAQSHPRLGARSSAAAAEEAAGTGGGITALVGEPPPPRALSHPAASQLWPEDVVAATVLAAAVAGCAAGLVLSVHPDARAVCLAALCGPFGVVARWYLSRANGALRRAPWLPLGTLGANVAACVFDAALGAGAARTRLGQGAYWGALLNSALQAGIGGGLSTVSTVAAETALLLSAPPGARWRGYAYLLITWTASAAPAAAIFGGATRRG